MEEDAIYCSIEEINENAQKPALSVLVDRNLSARCSLKGSLKATMLYREMYQ